MALALCGLLSSCTADGGGASVPGLDRSGPRAASSSSVSGDEVGASAEEAPPLSPLSSDDPDGPLHTQRFVARPSGSDLAEVSNASDTRRSAEEFAILFNHALEDRSPESAGSDAIAAYTLGLTPQELSWIEESRPALVQDAQVVPGSRSWIRSVVEEGASTTVDVYLVEKAQASFSPDQSEPLVYWSRARVALTWTDGNWWVTDYTSAVASERPRFSPASWVVIMDRGENWRRFKNG